MLNRKFFLSVFIGLFTASVAFAQSEVLKDVVNNLAFYKQKKDLKYLSDAKKSVDNSIKTRSDSMNLERNVYKAVVYSSILYTDSLNKLNQPADFLGQTTTLVDRLSAHKKAYKFDVELDFARRCLSNVYIRNGFSHMHKSDFTNAMLAFKKAYTYTPAFKPLNAYIAYANNKLGNLQQSAKYYDSLLNTDSIKAEYAEAAVNTYKLMGDTVKALQVLQKARRALPLDRYLLTEEANIYNNKKDYKALEPLLNQLLDLNPNSSDIAFIAANCYDHLNKYDKAESLYLRAIDLNNSGFDQVFNLGLLYFKQSISKQGEERKKNMERAMQWLEKANEMFPYEVKCLQVLQMLYTQNGNNDQLNKVNNKLKQLTY
jgi:tetratricopeptide (TPR) repeat protein